VCVSHRWITATHPDPDGLQLRELQQRLRALVDDNPALATCGIFYDYWSMPQNPRSVEETALFRQEMNNLSALFATANTVIILSEGYTNYHKRAWCYFEAVISYTATLNYGSVPASNIHFFADQASIASDLQFLGTSGFQRIFGHEVQFRSPLLARYRYNPNETEVISGIFSHLGSCATTEPEDKALIKSQLVTAVSQRANVGAYGRLIIALNKYFETSFHLLTPRDTKLLLKPHFERPDWPRVPPYYYENWSDTLMDSVFSLSPQDLETMHADGGLACMLIGLVHPDRRDMDAWVESMLKRGPRPEFFVQPALAGYPSEDPFPTLEHVMQTVLHLVPFVRPLPDSPHRNYFPLIDPQPPGA
jgi:hypothetical protein